MNDSKLKTFREVNKLYDNINENTTQDYNDEGILNIVNDTNISVDDIPPPNDTDGDYQKIENNKYSKENGYILAELTNIINNYPSGELVYINAIDYTSSAHNNKIKAIVKKDDKSILVKKSDLKIIIYDMIETFINNYNTSYILNEDEENFINNYIDDFIKNKKTLANLENDLKEGMLGSVIGGVTGFLAGKTIGKILANALGIEKGIFYDLLTSRLVNAALGAALGKRI